MHQSIPTTYLRAMKSLILFLLLLGTVSCKSNDAFSNKAESAPATPLILLETSPCRGFCPVFKLSFRSDGLVTYEGIRFVKKTGSSTFQLTKQELSTLKKKLKKANLWQYPESFPSTIMDAPGASLTIYKGKTSKTIRGSVERPKQVIAMQEYLQVLAEKHSIDLKGVDPFTPPEPENRTELLVKLKPEINAGNWLRDINQSSKADLRLIKRTGADNIWVVAFEKNRFKTEEILLLIRSNEQVVDAQENREVKERGN
jgi:hypothetical protein